MEWRVKGVRNAAVDGDRDIVRRCEVVEDC